MENINLTFGEGNEMARQKPDLYELVESLTKQLATLKLQLEQVQAEKLQQHQPQEAKEVKVVLPHYQIYFRGPATLAQVQAIMKDCVTEAIEEQYLKPDQYCKVELIRDDSAKSIW